MKAVIDHRILIGILNDIDDCIQPAKHECLIFSRDDEFLFFPMNNWYELRMDSLDSFQVLQRIRLLCLERSN